MFTRCAHHSCQTDGWGKTQLQEGTSLNRKCHLGTAPQNMLQIPSLPESPPLVCHQVKCARLCKYQGDHSPKSSASETVTATPSSPHPSSLHPGRSCPLCGKGHVKAPPSPDSTSSLIHFLLHPRLSFAIAA